MREARAGGWVGWRWGADKELRWKAWWEVETASTRIERTRGAPAVTSA